MVKRKKNTGNYGHDDQYDKDKNDDDERQELLNKVSLTNYSNKLVIESTFYFSLFQ